MPVQGVTVSLADVLEVKGEPLSDQELWSILGQSLMAIQDFCLTLEKPLVRLPYRVTLNTLMLDRLGSVTFDTSSFCNDNVAFEARCTGPEANPENLILDVTDSEKMLICSLGETLKKSWDLLDNAKASNYTPVLIDILNSMLHDDPLDCCSLASLFEMVEKHARTHIGERSFSYFIIKMYQLVLGSTDISTGMLEPNTTVGLKFFSEITSDVPLNHGSKAEHREALERSIPLRWTENWTAVTDGQSNAAVARRALEDEQEKRNNRVRFCDDAGSALSGSSSEKPRGSPNSCWNSISADLDCAEKKRYSAITLPKDYRTFGIQRNGIGQEIVRSRGPKHPQLPNVCASGQHIKEFVPENCSIKHGEINDRLGDNSEFASRSRIRQTSGGHEGRTVSSLWSCKDDLGPEFVRHSCQASVQLSLISSTDSLAIRKTITVVCLTGRKFEVECNPETTTAREIFSLVVQYQNLKERYLFGLACLKGGTFIFVQLEDSISKITNSIYENSHRRIGSQFFSSLTLHLKVKFYVDEYLIRYSSTKHMYYLQLRRDILENRISCDLMAALLLASFAMQAEYGDLKDSTAAHFELEYYFPTWILHRSDIKDIKLQLQILHQSHYGMSVEVAKQHFMKEVQTLHDYGFHFYSVLREKGNVSSEVLLGVSHHGISIFDKKTTDGENKFKLHTFYWRYISKILFDKRQFVLLYQHRNIATHLQKHRFFTKDNLGNYLFNLVYAHHRFHLMLLSQVQDTLDFQAEEPHSGRSEIEGSKREKQPQQNDRNIRKSESLNLIRGLKKTLSRSRSEQCVKRDNRAQPGTQKQISQKSRLFLNTLLRNKSRAPEVHKQSTSDARPNSQLGSTKSNVFKNGTHKAFVVDMSIHSRVQSPIFCSEETMNASLAERFENMTGIEKSTERRISCISLEKDEKNSLGMKVIEGSDGATYIQSVDNQRIPASHVQPGDRVLSVNGKHVENRRYSEVVDLIRNSSGTVTLLVSRLPTDLHTQPSNFTVLLEDSGRVDYGNNSRTDIRPTANRFSHESENLHEMLSSSDNDNNDKQESSSRLDTDAEVVSQFHDDRSADGATVVTECQDIPSSGFQETCGNERDGCSSSSSSSSLSSEVFSDPLAERGPRISLVSEECIGVGKLTSVVEANSCGSAGCPLGNDLPLVGGTPANEIPVTIHKRAAGENENDTAGLDLKDEGALKTATGMPPVLQHDLASALTERCESVILGQGIAEIGGLNVCETAETPCVEVGRPQVILRNSFSRPFWDREHKNDDDDDDSPRDGLDRHSAAESSEPRPVIQSGDQNFPNESSEAELIGGQQKQQFQSRISSPTDQLNAMVSKVDRSSAESGAGSPEGRHQQCLPESAEAIMMKTVLWQPNLSGSVKARISNFETKTNDQDDPRPPHAWKPISQSTKDLSSGRDSPNLMSSTQKYASSTKNSAAGPRVGRIGRNGCPSTKMPVDEDGYRKEPNGEWFLAVTSRPYKPRFSSRLMRSKTLPAMYEGVPLSATGPHPVSSSQSASAVVNQPLLHRSSWDPSSSFNKADSKPRPTWWSRANSIDESGSNVSVLSSVDSAFISSSPTASSSSSSVAANLKSCSRSHLVDVLNTHVGSAPRDAVALEQQQQPHLNASNQILDNITTINAEQTIVAGPQRSEHQKGFTIRNSIEHHDDQSVTLDRTSAVNRDLPGLCPPAHDQHTSRAQSMPLTTDLEDGSSRSSSDALYCVAPKSQVFISPTKPTNEAVLIECPINKPPASSPLFARRSLGSRKFSEPHARSSSFAMPGGNTHLPLAPKKSLSPAILRKFSVSHDVTSTARTIVPPPPPARFSSGGVAARLSPTANKASAPAFKGPVSQCPASSVTGSVGAMVQRLQAAAGDSRFQPPAKSPTMHHPSVQPLKSATGIRNVEEKTKHVDRHEDPRHVGQKTLFQEASNWPLSPGRLSQSKVFPFEKGPEVEPLYGETMAPTVSSTSSFRSLKNATETARTEIHKRDVKVAAYSSGKSAMLENVKSIKQCFAKTEGELLKIPELKAKKRFEDYRLSELGRRFSFINPDTTFEVSLVKNTRGLGISIYGGKDQDPEDPVMEFIRIRKLYPLQPAIECNRLEVGDVLLMVNGRHLTGLNHYEAVDALRVAPSTVTLHVCRPPPGTLPPVPQAVGLEKSNSLSLSNLLSALGNASPTSQLSFKDFEIVMGKRNGSLGFTIHQKYDRDHKRGHYVKALVKEPSLTDGRLQPGDQLLKVNDSVLSSLSHEEAVKFLRNCSTVVTLLVRRSVTEMQRSPTSPCSPVKGFFQETVINGRQDKKTLRKEAQDLLSFRVRGSSVEKSTSSFESLRQRRKGQSSPSSRSGNSTSDLTENLSSVSDPDSRRTTPTPTSTREPSPMIGGALMASNQAMSSFKVPRPTFLHLPATDAAASGSSPVRPNSRVSPSFVVSKWESDCTAPTLEAGPESIVGFCGYPNNTEEKRDPPPPPQRSPKTWRNSLLYSATLEGALGGETFPPSSNYSSYKIGGRAVSPTAAKKQEPKPVTVGPASQEVFTVHLNRSKNSRLGFSLISVEIGNLKGSFIRCIHPASIAFEDGRLRPGDRLIKVNNVCVGDMPTDAVIEMLRKSGGNISLDVSRNPVITNSVLTILQLQSA